MKAKRIVSPAERREVERVARMTPEERGRALPELRRRKLATRIRQEFCHCRWGSDAGGTLLCAVYQCGDVQYLHHFMSTEAAQADTKHPSTERVPHAIPLHLEDRSTTGILTHMSWVTCPRCNRSWMITINPCNCSPGCKGLKLGTSALRKDPGVS